jgi:hypothetical protein
MINFTHERGFTQTYNQGSKIQGKWLPSLHIMYLGEDMKKSFMKPLGDGFTWSPPFIRGPSLDTNSAPKLIMGGSLVHI